MLKVVKLVAVDIDGTLTHERPYIHLGAVKALRQLGKSVSIALVTGNPYPIAYALSKYLRPCERIAGIAENGGVVYLDDDVYINEEGSEIMEKVAKLLREIGYDRYPSEDSRFRLVDIALRIGPEEQEFLAEELSKRKLSVNITSSGYAVHIMPSGINKGKGLKMLCDRMGIDCRETAVIGDSYNDLDMFSIAGISISLPNAPEEVRRSADIVAGGPGYGYSLAVALKMVRRFIL